MKVNKELNKRFMETLDQIPEENRQNYSGAFNDLLKLTEKAPTGELPKLFTIKAFCRVCGTEQEQDLNYHGPNCAGFSFIPCGHSVHYEKGTEVWSENGFTVPESELFVEPKA